MYEMMHMGLEGKVRVRHADCPTHVATPAPRV
jgi:hypothetical protein